MVVELADAMDGCGQYITGNRVVPLLWAVGTPPGSVSPGPGGTAETRGVATSCISTQSCSKASWCLYGMQSLGRVFAAHHGTHVPFTFHQTPCHHPTAPFNPAGQPPAPSNTLNPNCQWLQGSKSSSGAYGGSRGCQAVGGTRVGDVATAPVSALTAALSHYIHHPSDYKS